MTSLHISLFGLNNVNSQLAAESQKNVSSLIIISLVSTIVAYVLVSPAVYWFWHRNHIALAHPGIFILMVFMIPIGSLCFKVQAMILGLRFNRAHNYIIFTEKALYGAVSLMFVYVGLARPETIWYTFATTSIIGLMIGFISLRKYYTINARTYRSLRVVFRKVEGIEKFAAYSYVSSIFVFSIELIISTMCAKYGGIQGLGVYGVARIIVDCLSVVFEYFNGYTRTQLSAEANVGRRLKIHAIMVGIISSAAIAVGVMLYVLSPFIMNLLFKERFAGSEDILRLLAISLTFGTISAIIGVLLRTLYKNFIIVILPAFYFINGLISALYLIPLYGAKGAALSTIVMSFTAFVCAVVSYLVILRQYKLGKLNTTRIEFIRSE
ncbi:MAG: hypothetical protein EB060_07825 [Proteobacteria bacterium]|nr:hypothetical protein [Pseudomonadota bacterium]